MDLKPVNSVNNDANTIRVSDGNSPIRLIFKDAKGEVINLYDKIDYFYLTKDDEKFYSVTDISYEGDEVIIRLPKLRKGQYKAEIRDKDGAIYPANEDLYILLRRSFEDDKDLYYFGHREDILNNVEPMVIHHIEKNPDKFKGEQGQQGIQGIKGDKGDKGDSGERGYTGDKGDPGKDGIEGEKGDKGDKGDKGEQGLQGIQGDKGDKGLDGYNIAINIKEFGAIGDGLKDDTIAFQNALDSNYSKIFIPEGNFIVEGLKISNEKEIKGHSKENSVITLKNKSDKGIFYNDYHINNLKFENLTFDELGNITSSYIPSFKFIDIYPLEFKNCNFENVVHGIQLDVSSDHSGTDKKHNIKFMECNFSSNDNLLHFDYYTVSAINVNTALNDGLIEHCNFSNLSISAIRVYPFGIAPNQIPPERWTINDNVFNNIYRLNEGTYTGSALYFRGNDLSFFNNRVHNIKRQPVDVQGINNQMNTAKNIRLYNNYIEQDNGFTDVHHTSICLFRNADVSFHNNILVGDIKAGQAKGLEVKWGGSLIATGNKITDSFRDCIDVSHSSVETLPSKLSNVIISDNILYQYGSTNTFTAIRIGSSEGKYIDSVIINNNVVKGHILRINKEGEGFGDIRRLVSSNNISNLNRSFFKDEGDKTYIFMLELNSNDEIFNTNTQNINRQKINGNLELIGGSLKLPESDALMSANINNMGRIVITKAESFTNKQHAFICLKNEDNSYSWKRLDMD